MRAIKLSENFVEFISFIIPRRSEHFQEDLYPPCIDMNPAQDANSWFSGKTVEPKRKDMNPDSELKGTTTNKDYNFVQQAPEQQKSQPTVQKSQEETVGLDRKQQDNSSQQVDQLMKENAALKLQIQQMTAQLNDLKAVLNSSQDSHNHSHQLSQMSTVITQIKSLIPELEQTTQESYNRQIECIKEVVNKIRSCVDNL